MSTIPRKQHIIWMNEEIEEDNTTFISQVLILLWVKDIRAIEHAPNKVITDIYNQENTFNLTSPEYQVKHVFENISGGWQNPLTIDIYWNIFSLPNWFRNDLQKLLLSKKINSNETNSKSISLENVIQHIKDTSKVNKEWNIWIMKDFILLLKTHSSLKGIVEKLNWLDEMDKSIIWTYFSSKLLGYDDQKYIANAKRNQEIKMWSKSRLLNEYNIMNACLYTEQIEFIINTCLENYWEIEKSEFLNFIDLLWVKSLFLKKWFNEDPEFLLRIKESLSEICWITKANVLNPTEEIYWKETELTSMIHFAELVILSPSFLTKKYFFDWVIIATSFFNRFPNWIDREDMNNFSKIVKSWFEDRSLWNFDDLHRSIIFCKVILENRFNDYWNSTMDEFIHLLIKNINDNENKEKQIKYYIQLLSWKRLENFDTRKELIDSIVSTIEETYWSDDRSDSYKKKILTIIQQISDTVNSLDWTNLINEICHRIESQIELTNSIYEILFYEKIWVDYLWSSSKAITWYQAVINSFEVYWNVNILLNFLNSSCNKKEKNKMINYVLEKAMIGMSSSEHNALGFKGKNNLGYIDKNFDQKSLEEMKLALENDDYSNLDKFEKKLINWIDTLLTNTYYNFRWLQISLRTLIISRILKSKTNNRKQAFTLISNKLFSKKMANKKEMKAILRAYIQVIPPYKKSLFLCGMMAAQEKNRNDWFNQWKVLATIFETMGTATIKTAQKMHSLPDMYNDITTEFKNLKSKAWIPTRKIMFNEIKKNVPRDVIDPYIDRVCEVFRASIDVWVQITTKDNEKKFLTLQPKYIEKTALQWFTDIKNTISQLRSNLVRDKTELHISETILTDMENLVSQVQKTTFEEINPSTHLQKHAIAHQQYSELEIKIWDTVIRFDTAKIFHYWDRFTYMNQLLGPHFNQLNIDKPLSTKQIAKCIIIIELYLQLTWAFVDVDRHGENVRYDESTTTVWIFDLGWMQLNKQEDRMIDTFIEIMVDGFSSNESSNPNVQDSSNFQSFMTNLTQKIRSFTWDQKRKDYLLSLQERFISLWDYFKHVDGLDILECLINVLKNDDIHPKVVNTYKQVCAKKWIMIDPNTFPTTFEIQKTKTTKYPKPIYHVSEFKPRKSKSMIVPDERYLKKDEEE